VSWMIGRVGTTPAPKCHLMRTIQSVRIVVVYEPEEHCTEVDARTSSLRVFVGTYHKAALWTG
jgi:hypothetical protein